MTAAKVWEYRHQVGASGGTPVYKYSDRVGAAHRLENGNTIVWFGADINPDDARPEESADIHARRSRRQLRGRCRSGPGRANSSGNWLSLPGIPVETLFGEVPALAGNGTSMTASPNPIPVTGAAYGTTTISWNALNAASVEIHVDSPNGPLFASGGNRGSQQTGAWVADGTIFYLQDVTGGKALTANNTLVTLVFICRGDEIVRRTLAPRVLFWSG